MLLATVLLSAALVPQTPAEEVPTPLETTGPQDLAPVPELDTTPAPPLEATPVPAEDPPAMPAASPTGAAQGYIDAGLKAFIRGRFSSARESFQKAYDTAPASAAAAFYLGYAYYKLGEPSRRMDADKERARELFAQAYRLDPMFQPVWGQKKQ